MPGFYSIVVPVGERRNLITNPSFEIGTAGHAITSSGVVGSTSNTQAFGAWCGSIVPGANGTAGWQSPTWTAGNGTAYGWSFYGSFPVGSTFIVGIGDSSGNNLQTGTLVGTGGGSWHRYVGSYTESTGASRRISLRKNNSAVTTAFYIDAVQVEAGSVTTYLDGDQGQGYTWDGQPHASTSLRDASVRTGGSVYNLGDLGFTVLDAQGVGMPDVNVVIQDYGYLDGGFYQRTRANSRSFILTGLMSGTTWQGLHAIRQRVIDTIRPDLTANPQPFRILYTGAGGSVQIDCVYDSGLTYGGWNGFAEQAAMRLIAPDPYWTTITEQGTSLAPFTSLGSTNHIAYRDSLGRWGTLGQNGTTIARNTAGMFIQSLAINSSNVLAVGGSFGSVGGTTGAGNFGVYQNGTFGTIASSLFGMCGNLAFDIFGTLWGFDYGIAGYTGSGWVVTTTIGATGWGTPAGGSVALSPQGNNTLYSKNGSTFVLLPASLTVGGTATRAVAFNNGARWGTLTGGTVDAAYDAVFAGDRLVISGPSLAGGSACGSSFMAFWRDGVFGTIPMSTGRFISPLSVAVLPSQVVIVGGIGTIGAGSVLNVAQTNLADVTAMSVGLGTSSNSFVLKVAVSPKGDAWAAGAFRSAGSAYPLPSGLARWTGASWVQSDITLPSPGTVNTMAFDTSGGLYVAGSFIGTATAASVVQLNIIGGAAVSPRLVLRGSTTGTAQVFQLNNNSLDTELFFNLAVQANEVITVALSPGSVSATSLQRGNVLNSILPGSNLAKWQLLPGTNYVSFFADNSSLRADLIYRPRFWSNDDNII